MWGERGHDRAVRLYEDVVMEVAHHVRLAGVGGFDVGEWGADALEVSEVGADEDHGKHVAVFGVELPLSSLH